MNKDELLKMQAVAIKKMEELQEVRKQVVKSIYDFLMAHNGGITIICDEEKKSWVGIEATDNETFYVSFDNSEKVFAENELGVKDIFDLNNFIINYYKEN